MGMLMGKEQVGKSEWVNKVRKKIREWDLD